MVESGLNNRIESPQFMSGGFNGESPVNLGSSFIAFGLPCCDLMNQEVSVVNAAVETLLGEDIDLDFGHVEPTGVLGRVMEFKFLHEPTCFVWRKGLIEGATNMGVQIVQYQTNPASGGEFDVNECPNRMCPLQFGAPFGDDHTSPTDLRLAEDKEIANAIADILIILQSRLTWLGRQRRDDLTDELSARFVHTDHGIFRVKGLRILVQYIFHTANVFTVGFFGKAPGLYGCKVNVFFFSVLRTVSSDTLSIDMRMTN